MGDQAPLESLAEVNPRSPSARIGESISFVAMADVSERGYLESVHVRPASPGYTPFVEGDVLLAKITPCMENGKGAHVRELPVPQGQGSTEFHVLRARPGTSDRFLYHLTRTESFRLCAEALMTGSAGQRRVPTEFFSRYVVRVPPLEEQRRIAEILDTFDETIQETERVIAKLAMLRDGLRADLIDGAKDSWHPATLNELGGMLTSGSRGWASYYAESGEVFLRIGNLTREHPNLRRLDETMFVRPPQGSEEQRTRCEPGDLLISITADLGIIGVIPSSIPRSYVNQHIARVRVNPDLANVRFVAHSLQSATGQRQFQRLNDSGAKSGLNLPAVGSLSLRVPALAIQRAVDLSRGRCALPQCRRPPIALADDRARRSPPGQAGLCDTICAGRHHGRQRPQHRRHRALARPVDHP